LAGYISGGGVTGSKFPFGVKEFGDKSYCLPANLKVFLEKDALRKLFREKWVCSAKLISPQQDVNNVP
jgi:hypothetical protein